MKFFRKMWAMILTLTICLANLIPVGIANAESDTVTNLEASTGNFASTKTAVDTKLTKAGAANCYDLTFVFARGSGEQLNDKSNQAWVSENLKALNNLNLDVSYNFYELGSSSQYGAQYPASAVSGSIGAIGTMVGAFVSGGAAFEFGRSVDQGATELLNYLSKTSIACTETKFVLGGYSQGAMLISRSLDQINPEKIIYVATFGDPKLYLPEGEGNHPVACLGKNLSNYRNYVSDCHAYEGILGSYQPYQPTGYYNKLGTYCNSQDIMCSSGMNISDHTAYVSRGIYQLAAQTIANRIRTTFQPSSGDAIISTSSHDLLLIFDVTWEMQTNINNYIAEAKSLVQRTRSLGGRVAIYTMWQQRVIYNHIRPYINQVCDFSSCEPEEVDQFINNLGKRLLPGAQTGDRPIYMALNQSMRELEWQVGATKTAVVFTSAYPKNTDYDDSTLKDVVNLSLAIDPVNVFAVTDNETSAIFLNQLAYSTGGKTYLLSDNPEIANDIFGRPSPQLALETYSGIVGDEITFDASIGLGQTTASLRYDWDLDADGIFELQSSAPIVQKTYSQLISGYIQVRVTDASGYSSTMSAKLDITAAPTDLSKITIQRVSRIAEQSFHIDYSTDASRTLVILNDAILGFIDSSAERSLTLTDILQTSSLKLIPYSDDGLRGEAATVILDLSSEIISVDISPIAPTTPTESISSSSVPIENKPSEIVLDPSLIESLIPQGTKKPALIPKAPDTGYFAE